MVEFARMKLHPVLAVYLIVTVSAIFLFAAVEPVRSFEFENEEPISDAYYTSPLPVVEWLAVIPKIGQNTTLKNTFSPFRLGSLRLFIFFGIHIITIFSGSPFSGKIQANPVNIKNTIQLKLRI
jgi:hypothetical protein